MDSVTGVILDALQRRVTSDTPVNLAFGSRSSLLDVIDHLEDLMGRVLPVEHGPVRAGDVRDSQADQSQLRQLFPDLQPVALFDGMSRTLTWMRSI